MISRIRHAVRALARRIAPSAYGKLERLGDADFAAMEAVAPLSERVEALEAENADLRQQLWEIRTDARRVNELYDLVIERLRSDNPLRGS